MPNPTPGTPTVTLDISKDAATRVEATEPKVRYVLYFMKGGHHIDMNFVDLPSSWNIQKVVDRVKRYCQTVNKRFVRVQPMMIDMDKEEAQYVDTNGA